MVGYEGQYFGAQPRHARRRLVEIDPGSHAVSFWMPIRRVGRQIIVAVKDPALADEDRSIFGRGTPQVQRKSIDKCESRLKMGASLAEDQYG